MCEVLPQTSHHLAKEPKTSAKEISEDEAALYDRQIRLWGVSAQKRLRNADVLMAGIDGVGSEVVKNIVLCGVNSLTLLDDREVSDYDTTCNLFTKRQIGKNRSEAAREAVQTLNPMVAVKCDTSGLRDKDTDFFKGFDVVILANSDRQTMIKVNNICKELKIKFFATCNWGQFGFAFTDLGAEHVYRSEEETRTEDVNLADYEPVKKKMKVEDNSKQFVEKKLSFVPIETALAVRAGKSGYGLTKRTNSTFIITHVILEFFAKHSRYPSADSREEDITELKELEKQVVERLGVDENIIKNKEWVKHVFGQLSPVCAIVGGVLAQDVIRAISQKDNPIRNFFLFDGILCNGTIESIGH